jgi:hypothetical protein
MPDGKLNLTHQKLKTPYAAAPVLRLTQCPQHQFGVWLTFTHIAVPLFQERRFERPLKLLNLGHILRLEQSVGDSLQLLTEQKNGFSIGGCPRINAHGPWRLEEADRSCSKGPCTSSREHLHVPIPRSDVLQKAI